MRLLVQVARTRTLENVVDGLRIGDPQAFFLYDGMREEGRYCIRFLRKQLTLRNPSQRVTVPYSSRRLLSTTVASSHIHHPEAQAPQRWDNWVGRETLIRILYQSQAC